MPEAWLVGGARTPIGGFGGALADVAAPELGAIVLRAALDRAGVAADAVEQVIMGNVLAAGIGQAPARQAALGAGVPSTHGALTINKVCGSGLMAVEYWKNKEIDKLREYCLQDVKVTRDVYEHALEKQHVFFNDRLGQKQQVPMPIIPPEPQNTTALNLSLGL